MSIRAYIALGSNLGDRHAHLDAALSQLRQTPGLHLVAVSRYWETDPVGGPPHQPRYLNAVCAVDTDLSAQELHRELLRIETALGRERAERYAPRTLDLDLLLYGEEVIQTPDLTVPHPRLHQRPFVLGPLAELAPTLIHPVLRRSIVELLADLSRQDLRGRCGVVTGASTGIGRAIALALAQRGADVIIHANRSRTAAEQVAAQARHLGVQAWCLFADIADADACRQLVNQVWSQIRPVDFWINNAGADILTGANRRRSYEAKLDLLWHTDVLGTVRLCREVGPRMKSRGWGVLVNMGWDQAETGMDGESGELFALAKGAIMAFTRSLAVNLAPEVRVNCLAPGWIRTAWAEKASEYWQQRAISETPLRRWGTPEDVAAVVCWMVSDQASFVTGQIIRINGGAVR
ncbi:MAG: 2-amino-4-hydroxy-6-hydroxymethyldihydropteridine diphosphokinase [Gemmatales bacterium]|nr:2-amino-4-hydroxy-6-hydroxymethyldihydropteridine diphosphokinase [Gemmatales bacterium]MCS7161246.1 2-amino-4-hydroxy-6-hydroxymethyldihydropteridine diphosphokinase [Gemmatales bacterium]MDW8176449.1 2-amino-4-hydroxy-6-hydroxymethyldihydropteridine diphosphokinase [Gemmatales bacterium]MDW8222170.1 2-amino-4-hydroxy-6-hydroxymethyldihydropteridine diphosphokinase [Gemmatales bacterium]